MKYYLLDSATPYATTYADYMEHDEQWRFPLRSHFIKGIGSVSLYFDGYIQEQEWAPHFFKVQVIMLNEHVSNQFYVTYGEAIDEFQRLVRDFSQRKGVSDETANT